MNATISMISRPAFCNTTILCPDIIVKSNVTY